MLTESGRGLHARERGTCPRCPPPCNPLTISWCPPPQSLPTEMVGLISPQPPTCPHLRRAHNRQTSRSPPIPPVRPGCFTSRSRRGASDHRFPVVRLPTIRMTGDTPLQVTNSPPCPTSPLLSRPTICCHWRSHVCFREADELRGRNASGFRLRLIDGLLPTRLPLSRLRTAVPGSLARCDLRSENPVRS
jgi:hypothetical protein